MNIVLKYASLEDENFINGLNSVLEKEIPLQTVYSIKKLMGKIVEESKLVGETRKALLERYPLVKKYSDDFTKVPPEDKEVFTKEYQSAYQELMEFLSKDVDTGIKKIPLPNDIRIVGKNAILLLDVFDVGEV